MLSQELFRLFKTRHTPQSLLSFQYGIFLPSAALAANVEDFCISTGWLHNAALNAPPVSRSILVVPSGLPYNFPANPSSTAPMLWSQLSEAAQLPPNRAWGVDNGRCKCTVDSYDPLPTQVIHIQAEGHWAIKQPFWPGHSIFSLRLPRFKAFHQV
jgi:hypothetical protein